MKVLMHHSQRAARSFVRGLEIRLKNWSNFMALSENKADLARFLSEQLITRAPESKEIVTAGGFRDELEVRSSTPTTPLSCLISNHEEADTRLALHAMNVTNDAVVVSARDTDVLVILVSHFHRMHCKELWMKAGTSKKQKYIPIHNVACNIPTYYTSNSNCPIRKLSLYHVSMKLIAISRLTSSISEPAFLLTMFPGEHGVEHY